MSNQQQTIGYLAKPTEPGAKTYPKPGAPRKPSPQAPGAGDNKEKMMEAELNNVTFEFDKGIRIIVNTQWGIVHFLWGERSQTLTVKQTLKAIEISNNKQSQEAK